MGVHPREIVEVMFAKIEEQNKDGGSSPGAC